MLIMTQRNVLNGDKLSIPEWIRAPLYLGEGARFFGAMQVSKFALSNTELILSPFDFDYWDDLWRIEIDTDDAEGNSLIMVSLLEKRGLLILAMESSVTVFPKSHSMSFIVSASSYTGDADNSRAERTRVLRSALNELRQDIIVYLGDKISFRSDRTPALKIRHLRNYRRFDEELKAGSRFKTNRLGDLILDGEVILTQRSMDNLYKSVGNSEITYSSAVDTKNRFINILFFGNLAPVKYYIRIAVSSNYDGSLSSLYKIMYNSGANIVRNTIRACPPLVISKKFISCGWKSPYLDELNYKTIDFTLEYANCKNISDSDVLFEDVCTQIENIQNNTCGLVCVLKKGNHDGT